jgi:hypothetical protein
MDISFLVLLWLLQASTVMSAVIKASSLARQSGAVANATMTNATGVKVQFGLAGH